MNPNRAYRWRWKSVLPERHGQVCRMLVKGSRNSCLIRFLDGREVITSINALRLARMTIDSTYAEVRARCPNAPVSWFLMCSFLYYHAEEPIVSDECFDGICRDLLARWDTIEHKHKGLIDREALRAGTGYMLAVADYPWVVRHAARTLVAAFPFGRTLPAVLLASPEELRAAAAARPVAPPPLPAPSPPAARAAPVQLGLF